MDSDLAKRLQSIEETLDAIRLQTRTTWRELLLAGLLKGSGLILGSAITLALAGWGLAFLGIVPGAEEIAEYLSELIQDVDESS